MTAKFKNRYRIESTRFSGYDYTRSGAYFITICSYTNISYFGNIIDGNMILSETGIIVRDFWLEIPSHFPNTHLDEFIIMPDHIHGILVIKSTSETKTNCVIVETPKLGVSTGKYGNLYWKSNSIGSIINQFKRICTIKTKSLGLDLSWQPRLYDHIIRSHNELNRIRTYIRNNPCNWINDNNQ